MKLKWRCTEPGEWHGFNGFGVPVAVADQYVWGWKARRKADGASKTFATLRAAKAWCEEVCGE